MIYISTSCVTHKKIKDSVQELAMNGFLNIELSGGTEYYDNFEKDLLELKYKYNLKYRCHNYFPPPEKHFVFNLASLNDKVFETSFNHLLKLSALSEVLESNIVSFHAGFYIDIDINEVGKKLSLDKLFCKEKSIERFCKAYKDIKNQKKNLSFYIENNVYSKINSETYNKANPFMMTNFSEYKSLKKKIDFNLLLDLAHLKVSSKTLNTNWEKEFENMMNETDYIHISENDGLSDLNYGLKKSSKLISILTNFKTHDKDFTLEVYDGMSSIKNSYEILSSAVI